MTKTVNHNLVQDSRHYRQTGRIASSATALPSPFKDLTFPLNVYAHALLLQEGKATYLHYGLFQNNKTSLQVAQQFSTDLLMARLPSPPCRILEVGVGLGTTLSLLNQRGYDVHGITPDAQQIAYIQRNLGSGASVSCHSLQNFKVQPESFDVVLLQESAQYIEPLVIFNKALDLLPLPGDLVIIDEFALKYDEAGIEGLHLLNDMVALAERFGFELVERMDLSTQAAPTLDYLLRFTATHRQSLIKDLALTDEQLAQLDESNRTYHKKYASGHYGYALLHFRKKMVPKWRLKILEKNQTPEMFSLFKKTFHHDMTPATWQWKYGSNSGREIGVWQENQLIAHYGGVSREILFFGQPQVAVQIGDVMVDASVRGMLTRKGPFFLMAATFPERFVGYGKPYLVGFGFPNERAMKVAERLGLYAEVGHMIEHSWKPLSKFPLWGTRIHLIGREQTDFTITIADQCWQHMAADLQQAIIGVRDWKYLQHRYLEHPNQQYQVILVKNRFSGRARGILILRFDPEGCEIVDLIASLVEIPLLIIHARRLAGIQGATRIYCHITENFSTYFAITGGTQKSTNIRIPATTWSNGPTPETLKNRWWLMSGDKDFR
ncbi:bifunctional class I SAM-dependent methyltransferase/GNAT family N-acetyltransferase [Nitrosomonas sp.]|uniref:bifunctional class I SAM-dependent methyltransferase/GNAT family N-acetyltransferase n=1 Tax=Nitrosomonas sp. TaxID=42353 RepID=UPI0025CBB35B|nr:bifunctional class I SAM-dependent methyltransferase/GNAT family N-acetyltransferase [Nitrosomonas sp.]